MADISNVDTRILEVFDQHRFVEEGSVAMQSVVDEIVAEATRDVESESLELARKLEKVTAELAKSKKDDDLLTAALQLQSSTLIEYRDAVQSVYAHENPIVRFLARFASWPAPKDSTGVAQHLAVVQATAEMARQDAKWGAGRQMPNGTSPELYAGQAKKAQESTDRAFAEGRGTWRHILLEEVYEALAESNPKKLKLELVQVAAVCLQWVASLILQRPKG